MEEIKNKILDEYKKGNIVVAGIEGLQGMPIADFIKQPADGILYDLNRNESTVLTFLPDPKWINDFAVAQVIRALKKRIDELEGISHCKLSEKTNYVLMYMEKSGKPTFVLHPKRQKQNLISAGWEVYSKNQLNSFLDNYEF